MENIDNENMNKYLSSLIQNVLEILQDAGCVEIDEDQRTVYPTR